MPVRLFAGFHDGAGGLQQCENDECSDASKNSVKSNFRQLEEGGESSLR